MGGRLNPGAGDLIESRTDNRASASVPGGPSSPPPWLHLGLVRALILTIAVAALAIAAGTAIVIAKLRSSALDAGGREARNVAAMIAQDLDRSVQAVERVQQGLVDRVGRIDVKSATEYETRLSGYDAHLMLRDVITGLPHVESITFVSANGKVFNTSRAWPSEPIDVSDRDYFRSLSADPHLEFAWSDPVRNRTTGTWSIYLARKVFGPNRELFGFVTAGLELKSFEARFASLAPRHGMSIALFAADDTLVAQFPHDEDAIGLHIPQGLTPAPVGVDSGSGRITAMQPVTRYPAEVVVAIPVSTVLAHWRAEASYLAAGAVLLLVLLGGIPLAAARFGSWDDDVALASARLQEQAQKQLNRKQQELEAAAENMPQGLVMFDEASRLVVCNDRYMKMYGLSAEIAAPGRSLQELIAYRIETGKLAADANALAAIVQETVRAGKSWRHIAELPDGRSIEIVTTPLSSGGWVATHTDITEGRRAERQLLRTEKFLATVIENVPTTITIKDARTLKYLLVNRAGERYFGLLRSEIIGKTAHELFPQASADLIESHDRQLLATGKELYISEHMIDTPAGERLAVAVRRLSIMDQNGDPQYLLSMIENVSERRLIEDSGAAAGPELAVESPAKVA